MDKKLLRLEVTVSAEDVPAATALLFQHIPYGWEERDFDSGGVLFTLHLEDPGLCESLVGELEARFSGVAVERSEVPDRDWSMAWREFFTAVPAGEDFVVIAPWMVEDRPFRDRIAIVIEPKMAFGTGHHPTTALCLEVASALYQEKRIGPGMRFLDLGTGSGVLGLGCAKLGLVGFGLDTDPQAIDNALENKEINKVGDEFKVMLGSVSAEGGFEADIPGDSRFDLILANILAEPLIDLAPGLVKLLAPGGVLVLSGLLVIQADKVAQAYLDLGMNPPRRIDRGEWSALVFEN